MPEWIPTNDGHPLKTTDAMLETIYELTRKRKDTLTQIDLWRETDPALGEIMNDLELHLR